MANYRRNLHGGRAFGMSPSAFDTRELVRGSIHETEHTDDPQTAMEIAMDHLVEHPDYYDVIEAVEATMSSAPRMTPNIATAIAEEAAVLAREAPVIAQEIRAAAPEIASSARVLIPRVSGWIARVSRWFKQGASDSKVLKMLVESGIPKRAAIAIEEAAKAFLAAELQNAAQKGAARLVRRRPSGVARTENMRANVGYYVWVVDKNYEPILGEGPYGPHNYLAARQFARISATKGKSARAVSRGKDPQLPSFTIPRIYAAGSGDRIL